LLLLCYSVVGDRLQGIFPQRRAATVGIVS
jgi:hypothetical protein